jgi:hypothetical protein
LKNPVGYFPSSFLDSVCCILVLWIPFTGSSQYEYEVGLQARGYLNNEQNPFWFYSNQLGMVSEQTVAQGLLDGHYRRYLGEHFEVEAGGSLFMDYTDGGENRVRANEYYASLGWKVFRLSVGARARPEQFLGLSSVNGDILWSNNARAIPGVEVGTARTWWLTNWFGLEGALGHYWLNDDRYVENPYLHYKYGTLNFQLSERSLLKFGLHHYAQWAGVHPTLGQLPNTFSDFLKVFFSAAGGPDSDANEQLNVLGNQLGSWRINYSYDLEDGHVSVYFQNMFDNTSGLEFNNFPDGVWGAFWELPENSIVKGLLYEYVRTTWLRDNGNGPGDNYFNNSIYRSGWTYFNRVIGVPFITPATEFPGMINNRITSHHLGVRASVSDLDIKFMGSYTQNLGLYVEPYDPVENVFYTVLDFAYILWEKLQIGLQLGADLSDVNGERFGAGLSFRYALGESYRMY